MNAFDFGQRADDFQYFFLFLCRQFRINQLNKRLFQDVPCAEQQIARNQQRKYRIGVFKFEIRADEQ